MENQEKCVLCGTKFHIPCTFYKLPSDDTKSFGFLYYKCNKCGDIAFIDRAWHLLMKNDMTDVKNKIMKVAKNHSNNGKKIIVLADDGLKNEWANLFYEEWKRVNKNKECPNELLTISEIIELHDKIAK